MNAGTFGSLTPASAQNSGLWAAHYQVMHALATGLDTRSMIDPVMDLTSQVTACKAAAFFLAEDGRLTLAGTRGLSPTCETILAHGVDARAQSLDDFVCCEAAQTGFSGLGAALRFDSLEWCWMFSVKSRASEFLGALHLFFTVTPPAAESFEASLIQSVCRMLGDFVDRGNLVRELRYQVDHDPVTGLFNRSWFDRRLVDEIADAERAEIQAGLVKIDIDRFSSINELLGHEVGDLVLRGIADRLLAAAPEGTSLARTGGDVFEMVIPGSDEEVESAGWAMVRAFEQPFLIGEEELRITASAGMACYPRDAADEATLERNAYHAVLAAKRSGGNTLRGHSAQWAGNRLRDARIERDLQRALDEKEFELRFQPLIRLSDRRVEAYEVLLRWRHRELGAISPSVFMSVAERTGLIVPIGTWVMEEACRLRQSWSSVLPAETRAAVNVSAVQFNRPDFADTLFAILHKTGLDPRLLEIELTESCVLDDPDGAARRLKALRERGISVSIDDFGTGYSSLATLCDLPCDTVKLDKSLLREVEVEGDPAVVLRRVVDIGRALRKRIVVEGIETESQLAVIEELACDIAQGYFFSRPVAEEEFLAKNGCARPAIAK